MAGIQCDVTGLPETDQSAVDIPGSARVSRGQDAAMAGDDSRYTVRWSFQPGVWNNWQEINE